MSRVASWRYPPKVFTWSSKVLLLPNPPARTNTYAASILCPIFFYETLLQIAVDFADSSVAPPADLRGSAQWAAGYAAEDLPEVNVFNKGGHSELWSIFQKAALFGVIVGAVALYLRLTKKRDERIDIGYEKTLA